jgi:hypothetical protein
MFFQLARLTTGTGRDEEKDTNGAAGSQAKAI